MLRLFPYVMPCLLHGLRVNPCICIFANASIMCATVHVVDVFICLFPKTVYASMLYLKSTLSLCVLSFNHMLYNMRMRHASTVKIGLSCRVNAYAIISSFISFVVIETL